MTNEQKTRFQYGLLIMLGIAAVIGIMAWKYYNGQLDKVVAIETGLMIGFAASIGIAFIVTGIWQRPVQQTQRRNTEKADAEIVIPKEDYVASIKLLGDKMASPDPAERQLAAQAYDAFKSSVRPS